MSKESPASARDGVQSINSALLDQPETPEQEYHRPADMKFPYEDDTSSSLSSALSNPEFPAEPTENSNDNDVRGISPQKRSPLLSIKGRSESATIDPRPLSQRRSGPFTTSPYFLKPPSKRVKGEKISCIPFPPLDATAFGLVQERLCHDSFQLLIAVIFLNKTRGSVAMPKFYELITRLPTPADLAAAKHEDIVSVFEHLGLQNTRATKCIKLAKTWLETPPVKGKRYRRLHYPKKDDGKDIDPKEGPITDEDERVAWEVGHLAGIGSYAIDSWRIFCRDELRGLPTGLPERRELERDAGAREVELGKEWTKVLPLDKELRAYLRWRWLRLGFEWDPVSGEKQVASERVMAEAVGGGVTCERVQGGVIDTGGNMGGGRVEELPRGESIM